MTEIIAQLLRDHQSFSKILNVLEQQVQSIEDDTEPDVDLLIEIMDYLRNYMDIFHHPREDLIFQQLLQRSGNNQNSNNNAVIEELLREHQQLSVASSDLSDAIDGAFLAEQPQPRDNLIVLARDYIERNRRHLELEEQIAFSLAQSMLDSDDWAIINKAQSDEELPSFEKLLEKQYVALDKHIRAMRSDAVMK